MEKKLTANELAVLEATKECSHIFTSKDIARITGLPRGTCTKCLRILKVNEYLKANVYFGGSNRQYHKIN